MEPTEPDGGGIHSASSRDSNLSQVKERGDIFNNPGAVVKSMTDTSGAEQYSCWDRSVLEKLYRNVKGSQDNMIQIHRSKLCLQSRGRCQYNTTEWVHHHHTFTISEDFTLVIPSMKHCLTVRLGAVEWIVTNRERRGGACFSYNHWRSMQSSKQDQWWSKQASYIPSSFMQSFDYLKLFHRIALS